MKCYLCGSSDYFVREGSCRDNLSLKIYECNECGLVFLSDFSHIEDSFYEENGQSQSNEKINISNTISCIYTDRRFTNFSSKFRNKKILDFGCGKGNFLKKLKNENISKELYSLEINESYRKSLEKDFIHYSSIEEIEDNSLDCITMFHVLEHLPDPLSILNNLYLKLKKGGSLLIEVPNCNDILLKKYNNKAFKNFTYWSCHLFLFNSVTIRSLINRTKFNVNYIEYYQRYSLSNHLYWLAEGKPGGHEIYSFLDDNDLNELYAKKLSLIGQTDTVIAEISK